MRSKRNTFLFVSIIAIFQSSIMIQAEGFNGYSRAALALALPLASNAPSEEIVTYEAFGAVGDGVNDDLPAICKAHEYANAHGLSVKTRPDATYHLGGK
ncbi:MAG: hypothetical protein JXM79_14275, partial [Sedimentisphaerales bacterium]|nr:hypothetical protein [Sedimentisphaerales bacterium]